MLQISSIRSPLLVHKTGHDPQVKTNKSPFYTNHPALDQILTSETTAVISGYTCDRLLLWDFQPLKIVNSLSSPAHKHMRIRQRHLNWKLQSLGVWISFQFRWIWRSEKKFLHALLSIPPESCRWTFQFPLRWLLSYRLLVEARPSVSFFNVMFSLSSAIGDRP